MAVGQKPDRALTPQKALPYEPHGGSEMGGAEEPAPALPIAAGSLGFVTPNPASLSGTQHLSHGPGIAAMDPASLPGPCRSSWRLV